MSSSSGLGKSGRRVEKGHWKWGPVSWFQRLHQRLASLGPQLGLPPLLLPLSCLSQTPCCPCYGGDKFQDGLEPCLLLLLPLPTLYSKDQPDHTYLSSWNPYVVPLPGTLPTTSRAPPALGTSLQLGHHFFQVSPQNMSAAIPM